MTRERSAEELANTATADAGSPSQPASVRQMLGRYRLERQLGAGGMGVVHAALDLDLERRVAIKLLHAGPSDATRARLLREARAMARLDHPNVVTIFEVDSIEGIDFVVMELVDGSTLDEWLRAAKRTPTEILDAFIAAGRGLAAAHAAGMVHRDFKPHNVLRSARGEVQVSDFGLARDAESASGEGEPVATPAAPLVNLTVSGAFVGTPAYMAPEQWARGELTPAVDQFAFCVALWEALAGERPFRGTTLEELRSSIERGANELDASKLPRRVRPVLLRGLARDPAARWPSMDALLAALARRRRIVPLFAAGGALIAAGVAIVVVASHVPPVPPVPPAPPDPTLAQLEHVHVPLSHDALIATISKVDDTHYTVPRTTVDQLLLERTDLAEGARAVPTKQDDAVVGFKLFSVRPRWVYAAFGLHDFDVVRAIDGVALTSTAALVDVYKRVRAEPAITVDYDRAGTPHQLVITVTP